MSLASKPEPGPKTILVRVVIWRRRLEAAIKPHLEVAAALYKTWPITLVIIGLTACFIIPGLAAEQTHEALLEYVRVDEQGRTIWGRYLLTVYIAIALGEVLQHSSKRLLESRRPSLITVYYRFPYSMIGRFPAFAVAIGFFSLQEDLQAGRHPYAIMGAGLVFAQVAYHLRNLLLDKFESRTGLTLKRGRIKIAREVLWFAPIVILTTPLLIDLWRESRLYFVSVAIPQVLGPVNIVLIAFAMWTLSALVISATKTRIPVFTLLAIIVIANWSFGLNDNHPIRRVPRSEPVNPILVDNAFYGWWNIRPDLDEYDDYPVILISSEGGGIRAAFFTAVVLARIVDRCPRAANHIFAISGVSGGAVGAAIHAAAMKARPPDFNNRKCDFSKGPPGPYENAYRSILTDDHLSPLLIRMLSTDAMQQPLPFPIDSFDRQLGLELSLERSFDRVFKSDVFAQSLYQLVPTATTPAVPYLLLNTTRVENGSRFTISPIYFQTDQSSGRDDWHAVDYLEAPSVVIAALTSARFPIISPPGYYRDRAVVEADGKWVEDKNYHGKKHRYVDGGYFDNSGVPTLLELYRAMVDGRNYRDMAQNQKTFSIHTLYIGNAPSCDITAASGTARACNYEVNESSYSGLFSDIAGLFETSINVRDARVAYGVAQFEAEIDNQSSMHQIKEMPTKKPGMLDSRGRVQMLDRGISTPLGWLLSHRAASELASQLDPSDQLGLCNSGKQFVGLTNFCELSSTLGRLHAK